MLRSTDIDDWYRDGLLLRRWAWVETLAAEVDPLTDVEISPAVYGARCPQDPLSLLTATEDEITAQLAANAVVRALVQAAEPAPEPVEVREHDIDGNLVSVRMEVAEPPPPAAPVPRADYRTLRKLAYLRAIGGSGDPVDGFGNAADAQYWSRHGDPAPLEAMDEAVGAIKAAFPKPPSAP